MSAGIRSTLAMTKAHMTAAAKRILREQQKAMLEHESRVRQIQKERLSQWFALHATADLPEPLELCMRGAMPDGKMGYLSHKRIAELAESEAGEYPTLYGILKAYADGKR
jgi:hypothetical protein